MLSRKRRLTPAHCSFRALLVETPYKKQRNGGLSIISRGKETDTCVMCVMRCLFLDTRTGEGEEYTQRRCKCGRGGVVCLYSFGPPFGCRRPHQSYMLGSITECLPTCRDLHSGRSRQLRFHSMSVSFQGPSESAGGTLELYAWGTAAPWLQCKRTYRSKG